MKSQPYLSVIIPFYNEADNFRKNNLKKVYDFLTTTDFTWEMILVNDGSSDNSLELARDFASSRKEVRIVDNPHQGKAATVAAGVAGSIGEYILFSDTDQATPIEELNKFLPHMKAHADIIIGSRSGRVGAPLYRQFLALGMVVFRTLILRLPFKDTQCGFKAFKKNAADKIFGLMESVHPSHPITGPAVNPGFDVELLFLGRKMGFTIVEVPVDWHHQESKRVSFVKDAVNGIKELLLIRYRSITGMYKI